MLLSPSQKDVKKITTQIFYPTFENLNEQLAAITNKNRNIQWNKPTSVGATIFDFVGFHMYDFNYNVMQKYLCCSLLSSDTDSFLYEITGENVYRELQKNIILSFHFDFSNYPPSHDLYNTD